MRNRHDSYFGRTGRVGLLLAAGLGLMALASEVRLPDGTLGDARPEARAGAAAPELVILRADRLPADGGVRERLWLLNPSPLYMPGGDEAGPAGLPERPGGRAAELFAPALTFPDRWPGREILRPAAPGSEAEAAGVLSESRWFDGMVRSGEIEPTMPGAPLGRMIRFTLYRSGVAAPEAVFDRKGDGILAGGNWRPMDLSVAVGEIGAIVRPSVTTSSGDGRVDEWVRRMVAGEFLPKIPLRPGIYRVEVSP